ncbi:UDP-GlcA beta-glucuronosyltransferase, putative, gt70A [Roseibium sp. TrichSKD4]|uniref:GumK N-terminal domain-containing glycosyltransferase n=1 Tax=Roseibium sp. TrichSKD4 TaxID=744980 RepID=UPI0001E5738F|nr:UDP-GlcA beta-glucuronosyltransferase, putative, gt70A [Roseibium sp. TrichSKD4]EFO28586.1 UDP-GlcA beta-glucuronosyltransferase, putative, gt70A [Roseibium sp. TrichSKD4]
MRKGHTPLRIAFLSAHVFLNGFRKTSVHFVAEEFAKLGHTVHFTTISYSMMSRLKGDARYSALKSHQNNRYIEVSEGLYAGAYLPAVHPFSSTLPIPAFIEEAAFRAYGNSIPDFMSEQIQAADIVFLESGTAIAFAKKVKELNPRAKLVYFCRDRLATVGAAPSLVRLEKELSNAADLIIVPSQFIGHQFEQSNKVHFVPQGVDKVAFDASVTSPYKTGTLNAIMVGDMLFNANAVASFAKVSPHVDFHLFGTKWAGPKFANLIDHGEASFSDIVPFVKHANIALAPYKPDPQAAYLAESSLKLKQFAYCQLPILIPSEIPIHRGNEVHYDLSNSTPLADVLNRALDLKFQNTWSDGILDWAGVAERTLAPLIGNDNSAAQQPLGASRTALNAF